MEEALSVGSDPEDDALRAVRKVPFGEGAALPLGGNERLEFFAHTTARLVLDHSLVGFVAHIHTHVRERSPPRHSCGAIDRSQVACDR